MPRIRGSSWDDHEFVNNYADMDVNPAPAARSGRGAPCCRLPCLLGAHAARARKPSWAGPAALPALHLGVDRHLQRARRPPVPLRPAGLQGDGLARHRRLLPGRPGAGAEHARRRAARLVAARARHHARALELAQQTAFAPFDRGTGVGRGTWAWATTGTATSPNARCCSTGWSSTRTQNPGDPHRRLAPVLGAQRPAGHPQLRRPAGGHRADGHVGLHQR